MSSTTTQTTTTQTTTSSSPLYLSTSHSRSPASKKMSLTQTYFLAHKARGKLSHEAARPDHNLRLLVGHANLLDSLMLDLADAEREQESWFNSSVRGASPKTEEKHIQWADTVIEEPEEDWRLEDTDLESDSSDSDSDYDEDEERDVEMADAVAMRRMPAKSVTPTLFKTDSQYDDMEEDDDEEEDYAQLTLTRTNSHSHSASPPELDHDSDSSEDESMPPSPPTAVLPTFSEKQKESISTAAYYDSRQEQEDKDAFYDEGFYLPARNPARLVSAISVY